MILKYLVINELRRLNREGYTGEVDFILMLHCSFAYTFYSTSNFQKVIASIKKIVY